MFTCYLPTVIEITGCTACLPTTNTAKPTNGGFAPYRLTFELGQNLSYCLYQHFKNIITCVLKLDIKVNVFTCFSEQ